VRFGRFFLYKRSTLPVLVKVYFTYERVVNAGCMWSGVCSLTVVNRPYCRLCVPARSGGEAPFALLDDWFLGSVSGHTVDVDLG
jgi:hypothetical protein